MGNYILTKKLILISILVIAFIFGILNGALFGKLMANPPLKHIEQLLFFSLVYLWYHFDKKMIAYKAKPIMNIGVAVLFIITLPIYFFRTRSTRQATIQILLLMFLLLITIFLVFSGAMLGKKYF